MRTLNNFKKGHFSSVLYIIIMVILVGLPQSSEAGFFKTLGNIGKVITYPVWKTGDFIFVEGVYKGFLKPCYEKGKEMERLAGLRRPKTLTGIKVHFSTDGKNFRNYAITEDSFLHFCLLIDHKSGRYTIRKPMFRRVGTKKWYTAKIGVSEFGAGYRLKYKLEVPKGQYGEHLFEAKVEVWNVLSNTFVEYLTCDFEYKLLRPGRKW